jgi:hypothetical protein
MMRQTKMIPETEVLSEPIGTLYDTPLDRALWPDVLRKLAEFIGGSAATIFSKNAIAVNGSVHCESDPNSTFRPTGVSV